MKHVQVELLDVIGDRLSEKGGGSEGYICVVYGGQTHAAKIMHLSNVAFKGSHRAIQRPPLTDDWANACYDVADPTINHIAVGLLREKYPTVFYRLDPVGVEDA